MPLSNPYDHIPRDSRHMILTRVDAKDWHFIKRLYPMAVGLQDNILSTLFHRFIQHLRNLETSDAKLEPAWYPGDPTYTLLDIVLERCNFRDVDAAVAAADAAGELRGLTAGRAAGVDSGGDVAGRTDGVRATPSRATLKRTNPKGKSGKGGYRRGGETGTEEKGQCGTSPGVPDGDEGETNGVI